MLDAKTRKPVLPTNTVFGFGEYAQALRYRHSEQPTALRRGCIGNEVSPFRDTSLGACRGVCFSQRRNTCDASGSKQIPHVRS